MSSEGATLLVTSVGSLTAADPGWRRPGCDDDSQGEVVLVVSLTPQRPRLWPAQEVVSTDELVRRSAAQPFTSVDDLPGSDPFASDQEYDDFLTDLYRSRRAGPA